MVNGSWLMTSVSH